MEPIQNPFIGERNSSLAMAEDKFGRAKVRAQEQYAQEDMQKEMMRQQQIAMSQPQLSGLNPNQGLQQPALGGYIG
jgi:hypothetical protein